MRFRTHLLVSSLAGVALYPHTPIRAAALVLSGTLIDLDHLVVYALQTGDWSVIGALAYDRYRHNRGGQGDTRPRYGSLRSWIHRPWLILPAIWVFAAKRPALRPIAIGLTLHLLLDHLAWPRSFGVLRRARGRCEGCGRAQRRLVVHQRREDDSLKLRALCRVCVEQSFRVVDT